MKQREPKRKKSRLFADPVIPPAVWTAALILAAVLMPAGLLSAQSLRDPQFMAEADAGFAQIFNLNYDEAEATFSWLRVQYPTHPAPPFYLAVALWLRELFERQDLDLNKFVAPSYFDKPTRVRMAPDAHRRFFELVKESRKLAEDVLATNPDNNDALYFVASSHGLAGAFAITVDHNTRDALSSGKKAYELHRQLVSRDAQYYDSYMTLGMYEYISSNLPWYIKWLAWVAGYRGSEKRGFEYLRLAAERGRYVADEARLALITLYVREEQYPKALELAEELHAKYPRNFIFHLNRAQILERMGETARAAAEYQDLLNKAAAKVPNYTKLDLTTARYVFGLRLMNVGREDLALTQFLASIDDPDTPARERVLSHLGAGQALDLLGRRSEAVAQYQAVLKLEDFEKSHHTARKLIDRKYRRPS